MYVKNELEQNYIYLLPTKNRRYFKFGKSSIGQKRTGKLHKIYRFDFNRGLIFFGERKTVYNVETELKKMIPQSQHVYGDVDGSTEIRDFRFFGKVISLLRKKALKEYAFNEIFGNDKVMQTAFKTINSIPNVERINRNIRRTGRLDFFDYISLYPFNFIKYYFDHVGCLNLEFIRDYDCHYKSISDIDINRDTYKKEGESRIVFRLLNNDKDIILPVEICRVLCIYPSKEERYLAIFAKQRSLNMWKELCESDSPICFKDFCNDELEYICPSSIFNDLDQILTTKLEDNFLLRYRSGVVKRIFYRNSIENNQYSIQEDRNQYFLSRFNQAALFKQRCLILNDDQAENYFWNCAKYFGIQLKTKRPRNNAYGGVV